MAAAVLCWAALERALAPAANSSRDRFDALIVLGNRVDDDGNPTPAQLARVTEAVHEYERGVAAHVIVTGGAVSNRFVEAQVMARTAEAQGVPPGAVFIEPKARDTVQNACYAVRLMQAHGWHSAEVISSSTHLPRAALIFDQMPIEWRTHAAPALEPASPLQRRFNAVVETLKTLHYLAWGRWSERCQP